MTDQNNPYQQPQPPQGQPPQPGYYGQASDAPQQPQPPYPPYGQAPYGQSPYTQPAPPVQQYPGQYPPPYGQPGYYPQPQRTNTLAIITIILAFLIPLGAIITGHIATNQIRQSGEDGAGLAKAGLILGYVFTGLFVLFWILYIGFFGLLFSTAWSTSRY